MLRLDTMISLPKPLHKRSLGSTNIEKRINQWSWAKPIDFSLILNAFEENSLCVNEAFGRLRSLCIGCFVG